MAPRSPSSDPLHRVAERLVEMRETKADAVIDADVVEALARDVGLSTDDIAQLRDEAKGVLARAQSMRSAGALDPAIDTLELARAFHSIDLQVSYALADALYARARKTKNAADLSRAHALCLEVLQAAPAHTDAAVLLQAVRNETQLLSAKPTSLVPLFIAIAVAMVALAGFTAWLLR